MTEYHNPVLLHPSVDAVVTNPDGLYVDATFGGGGHSREILSRLSPKGRLLAFDREAFEQALLSSIPQKTVEMNKKAFALGYAAA